MYLSDVDIKKALKAKEITIENFQERRLQPASYDILLGNKFIINESHSSQYIDPQNGIYPQNREIEIGDEESFVLHPGVSVLGTTVDYVGANGDYLIHISGKSSLARIGLIVHNTAGIVNPGHFLHITLELGNMNNIPIVLRPKMEIAQLLFSKLTSSPSQNYDQTGRYSQENWTGIIPPAKGN